MVNLQALVLDMAYRYKMGRNMAAAWMPHEIRILLVTLYLTNILWVHYNFQFSTFILLNHLENSMKMSAKRIKLNVHKNQKLPPQKKENVYNAR